MDNETPAVSFGYRFVSLVLIYSVLFQSVFFAAQPVFAASGGPTANADRGIVERIGNEISSLFATNGPESSTDATIPDPLPPDPPAPAADAAISIRRPSLNGGSITGSLRVNTGEAFNINSPFSLTGDL